MKQIKQILLAGFCTMVFIQVSAQVRSPRSNEGQSISKTEIRSGSSHRNRSSIRSNGKESVQTRHRSNDNSVRNSNHKATRVQKNKNSNRSDRPQNQGIRHSGSGRVNQHNASQRQPKIQIQNGGVRSHSEPRVKGSTSIQNGVRTVRVNHQPEVQTFHRSNIRYDKGHSRRPIYLNNDTPVTRIHFQNQNYYINDGYFYQWHDKRYKRVAAPIGYYVSHLPKGFIHIFIGNRPYYYYNGAYYHWHKKHYYIVQPPVGAVIYALPMDYERVFVNGFTYYEYFGVLYSKIFFNGQPAYQVVGYIQ